MTVEGFGTHGLKGYEKKGIVQRSRITVQEMKKTRNVLSVSLPERIAKELNGFAKATGRNKSDIIKESLSNYLWEIKFRETRKRLSTRAKKAGFITDDDIFKATS